MNTQQGEAFHGNISPTICTVSLGCSPGALGGASQADLAEANSLRGRETIVPAACLGCRSKHLKCDGQNPCSRCVASTSDCLYVASRRGYKGPRRGAAQNPNKRQATSPPEVEYQGSEHGGILLGRSRASTPRNAIVMDDPSLGSPTDHHGMPFGSATAELPASLSLTNGALDIFGRNESSMATTTATAGTAMASQSLSQRCIDSFYHHFHAAHPFVLPKGCFSLLSQLNQDGTVEPLLAAMRWVGSLYIDIEPFRDSLLENAEKLVGASQRVVNGFLVQAMLLLILGLDGSDQQEKAKSLLGEAESTAIRIGLNTRSFANLHGQGSVFLEESWRRTWWDLFVVDAMIAGAHRSTSFALYDTPTDVALPCEEHQYVSGNIPQPLTLEDLEDQEFSGEDREFSSFTYRILSVQNLGKFMRMPPMFGPDDENIARVEATLTNFRLHLPASKRHAIQKDGKVDEMVFQALMMNHATAIILHQPFSQLDSSPTQSINACAAHQVVQSWDVFNAHTRHTITSATEISKLVTHQAPLTSHTHFFACIVTLASIVHLSKWALFFVPHDDDDLRQQIKLNIGALKEMSAVWRAAERTGNQVRRVAQEIYRLKRQQQANSQYWLGFTQQQILESIATDESIIQDIEKTQVVPPASEVPPMPCLAAAAATFQKFEAADSSADTTAYDLEAEINHARSLAPMSKVLADLHHSHRRPHLEGQRGFACPSSWAEVDATEANVSKETRLRNLQFQCRKIRACRCSRKPVC